MTSMPFSFVLLHLFLTLFFNFLFFFLVFVTLLFEKLPLFGKEYWFMRFTTAEEDRVFMVTKRYFKESFSFMNGLISET